MKKRLASLVIGLSVALSLAIPVGAAEMKTPVTEFESVTKEETIIHDVEFLSDATITTEDLGNDTYAIQLRNQEEPYINSESGESSSTTATIVAFGEEEFQEIEQSVQAAVSSASKKKESGWIYMGNPVDGRGPHRLVQPRPGHTPHTRPPLNGNARLNRG